MKANKTYASGASGKIVVSGPKQQKGSFARLMNNKTIMAAFVVVFGGLGAYLLFISHADTPTSKILYVAPGSTVSTDLTSKVMLTDGEGTTPTTLLTSPANTSIAAPTWSPSGTSFTYAQQSDIVNEAPGTPTLYVANADGSSPKQLSTPGYTVKLNSGILWSADGSKVLVSAIGSSVAYDGSQPLTWLWVNTDGSGDSVAAASEDDTSIPFAVTANDIYYQQAPEGTPGQTDVLCSMQIASPNTTSCFDGANAQLTKTALSSDGTTIASVIPASESSTGSAQIMLTPVGSSTSTTLTLTGVPASQNQISGVVWVPNSKYLAFQAYANGEPATWYVINTTNSQVSKLNIDNSIGSLSSWWGSSNMQYQPGSYYNPLSPTRIADTRTGSGEPYAGQTIGAGKTLNVQVAGKGGVPATGATAVVVNVTEATSTAGSYLTVYPTGGTLPTASTLNFNAGTVVNNQTTATLGTNGQISIHNNAGNTNVVVDVVGYYAATGDSYFPVTSTRVVDTRPGSSVASTAGKTLKANGSLTVQLAGDAGMPAGATAAVVEATEVGATAGGYLTMYPAGGAIPGEASNLNFYTGQTLTKEATVALGTNPQDAFTIVNHSSGTTNVIIDLVGYYTTGVGGMAYVPLSPTRIADTRTGSGEPYAGHPIPAGQALSVSTTGNSANIAPWAGALVDNLTIPSSTTGTYLLEYPLSIPLPVGTSITYTNNGVAVNENTVAINSNDRGGFSLYNNAGSTNAVIDALGYYY